MGYKFFIGFTSDTIQAMPSMKEYLSLTSKMLLAFGFAFELPIILTGMAALGVITADFLKNNRKYAIVLAFIIGGVLTPSPDVVSQVMMAGPLIVLYEMSILGARVFGRKKPLDADTEENDKQNERNKATAIFLEPDPAFAPKAGRFSHPHTH